MVTFASSILFCDDSLNQIEAFGLGQIGPDWVLVWFQVRKLIENSDCGAPFPSGSTGRGRKQVLFSVHKRLQHCFLDQLPPTDVWFHVLGSPWSRQQNTGATVTGTHRCDDEENLPLSVPSMTSITNWHDDPGLPRVMWLGLYIYHWHSLTIQCKQTTFIQIGNFRAPCGASKGLFLIYMFDFLQPQGRSVTFYRPNC